MKLRLRARVLYPDALEGESNTKMPFVLSFLCKRIDVQLVWR